MICRTPPPQIRSAGWLLPLTRHGPAALAFCAALLSGAAPVAIAQEALPALSPAQTAPMPPALAQWRRLMAQPGDLRGVVAFLSAHPEWPGREQLRAAAEDALPPGAPPELITALFAPVPPRTAAGALAWLSALPAEKHDAAFAQYWPDAPLDRNEANALIVALSLENAPQVRVPPTLHFARLQALLADQKWRQAEDILPLVPQARRPLARARIAVQSRRDGVDDLIRALPLTEQNDPMLALDRFRWRVAVKAHETARELMIEQSQSEASLGDPLGWAEMRVDYTRAAMRAGDWPRARALITPHFLKPGEDYYHEAAFLTGYSALKDGDPTAAIQAFQRLEDAVTTPVSLSRALYWQGRAAAAAGQPDAAQTLWKRAAGHSSAFYGQIAAEAAHVPADPAFAITGRGLESLPDWRGLQFDDARWDAARWHVAQGEFVEARQYMLALVDSATPEQIGAMARMLLEVRQPQHALRLAKSAAARGVILPAALFPLTGFEALPLAVDPALALAIARQESEFNVAAGSHVGAKGLMQLMPATAKQVARRLDLPFREQRLSEDGLYNATLGSEYLRGLQARYGPSSALIAVGYNAGPGRSNRWIVSHGDPRNDADPIDWVEAIPFDETRNYVMRVTEALAPYRARLSGQPVAPTVLRDLSGGGIIPPLPKARQTIAETLKVSRRPPQEGDPMTPEATAFDDSPPVLVTPDWALHSPSTIGTDPSEFATAAPPAAPDDAEPLASN